MVLQILWSLLAVPGLFQQTPAPTPPAQSFRISGTVVDALSGQPLSRAQVFIALQTERDSTQSTTTGDDGRFAFLNLAPGTYALSAERRGYVGQAYKQHESFSTAVILGLDRQPGDLRFELNPAASVSGHVFDETSEPLRNAQVMLLRQDLRQGRRATRRQQVVTDDLGRYHFGHLPPGTYLVSVSAQPWYAQRVARQHLNPHPAPDVSEGTVSGDPALDVTYPVTFYSNATDFSAASPINLRPGVAETADITLRPVPAIHLIVRYSPGTEPEQFWVQQATLHLAPGIDQGLGIQTSQSEPGVFEIMNLPPGRVSLGFGFSKGNESTAHSQTLQLSGGDSEINVADLPPATTVTGVVAMDDGSPLTQQASVRMRNTATGAVFDAQLQPSGEFSFTGQGIPAGNYAVGVVQSVASAVRSISATGAKVSGRTVEISSSPDVRLSVVVSKGTLQFPLDKPLSAALVKKMVKVRVAQNKARQLRRSAG